MLFSNIFQRSIRLWVGLMLFGAIFWATQATSQETDFKIYLQDISLYTEDNTNAVFIDGYKTFSLTMRYNVETKSEFDPVFFHKLKASEQEIILQKITQIISDGLFWNQPDMDSRPIRFRLDSVEQPDQNYIFVKGKFSLSATKILGENLITTQPSGYSRIIWVNLNNSAISSNELQLIVKASPNLGPRLYSKTILERLNSQQGRIITALVLSLLAAMWAYLWRKRKYRIRPYINKNEFEYVEPSKEISSIFDDDEFRQSVPDVDENLVQAIAAQRSILTFGAGVSAQAGYPNGSQLLTLLGKRLGDTIPDHIHSLISQQDNRPSSSRNVGEFSFIMEAILGHVKRDNVIKHIHAILSQIKPGNGVYKSLDMDWAGQISLVWDQHADQSLSKTRLTALEDGKLLGKLIRDGEAFLLRALGDLNRPSSISLHLEEFRYNLSRSPEIQRQLALLLSNQAFFFVGVSLQNIKDFLQAVSTTIEVKPDSHYALVPYDPSNQIYKDTLKQYGVKLLEYKIDPEHSNMRRFLRDLRDEVNSVSKPSLPFQTRGGEKADKRHAANQIKKLELTNIGPFEKLTVVLNTKAGSKVANTAPWTVFMGANGTGKSIIMKSIAVALCGSDENTAKNAQGLLKFGTQRGSIKLTIGDGEVLRTDFTRDRGRVIIRSLQTSPVEAGHILVLGFPALRGAPTQDPDGRKAMLEARPPEPADLKSLITGDVDNRMANFKQWIINVLSDSQSRSRTSKTSRKIRALLDGIITEMVPGGYSEFADIDSDNILRLQRHTFLPNSGESTTSIVDFNAMSQGMASIFNWVGVLIQRLYDFYGDEKPVKNNETPPEKRAAIVLVDEIDAHLHPEWQRNLVHLTRKHFPNVQIIASSHSALMAGSLRKYEIRVIGEKEDDKVEVIAPRGNTFGRSASDIFTGEVMGLSSERAPEMENKIDEYTTLYQKKVRDKEDKARFEVLKGELKAVDWPGLPEEKVDIDFNPSRDEIANFNNMIKKMSKDNAPDK